MSDLEYTHCDIMVSTDGSKFYLLDVIEWEGGKIGRIALPLDRIPGLALIDWGEGTLAGADLPPGLTITGEFW